MVPARVRVFRSQHHVNVDVGQVSKRSRKREQTVYLLDSRSQESKHEEVRSTVTKLGASYDVPTAKKVKIITLKDLMQAVRNKDLTRSAGVGIFLTRNPQTLPRALSKMVARIGALPKSIILLTVKVEEDPFVLDEDRISVRMLDLANGKSWTHICQLIPSSI